MNSYPVDGRGLGYSYAFIGIKRLGAGQLYAISIRDKDGEAFDGGKTYRLNVPSNVPVEQYWSVTAYDRQTHALIKGMPRASRSSQIPELKKNADGSIDIYFGPKAPGGKESNWLPTDPARKFELMARFYAPKPEFLRRSGFCPTSRSLRNKGGRDEKNCSRSICAWSDRYRTRARPAANSLHGAHTMGLTPIYRARPVYRRCSPTRTISRRLPASSTTGGIRRWTFSAAPACGKP
jgi:hypothetical protein